eukprot:tig00001024_g6313.t1
MAPTPDLEKDEAQREGSPEERATFVSRVAYLWISGLLARGYRTTLEHEDLPSLRSDLRTAGVCDRFAREWDAEQRRATETGKKPSLYRPIWRAHRFTLLWTGVCQLSFYGSLVVNSMIMHEILAYFADPFAPRSRGYGLAAALFIVPVGSSLMNQQALLAVARMGMTLRSATSALIYRKSLLIDGASRQRSTVGQITNLMASDCQRFSEMAFFLHLAWIAPLIIITALVLLVWVIGWQALVGVATVISLIPLNAFLATKTQKLRAGQSKMSDERVKTVNEVLQGIRVIKLYAWEQFFRERAGSLRARERTSGRFSLLVIATPVLTPA